MRPFYNNCDLFSVLIALAIFLNCYLRRRIAELHRPPPPYESIEGCLPPSYDSINTSEEPTHDETERLLSPNSTDQSQPDQSLTGEPDQPLIEEPDQEPRETTELGEQSHLLPHKKFN
jgi:hypothetical protein